MADETNLDTAEGSYEHCDEEEEGACKMCSKFDISFKECHICGIQHDSTEFGPYCALCHDFLYPDASQIRTRQTEREQCATSQVVSQSQSIEVEDGEVTVSSAGFGLVESDDCEHESESPLLQIGNDPVMTRSAENDSTTYKLPYLSLYERIRAPDLVAKRLANELNLVKDDMVEALPPEILLMIFSFLDDISLCMVGQVCHWWYELAGEHNQWRQHVLTRWPLFKSKKTIKSWQKLYIKMLQGVTCRRCFEQGCVQHFPEDDIINSWRNKRLKSELKGLKMDPPEGICACPLDSSLSYWQASIKGPPSCPYEEGLFFLHLEIPKSYPMRPPIVKFITRIYHPNVSYHGDIGLDTLQHNWSLALTIPKVLVSIQSLMSDPYCQISMEPEVAYLCEKDREVFDRIAREWTRKYAQAYLTC
ncbi:uncharacterized protein [Montipora capricornis]|uniref:uncharacterized protein isoform X2 n=1 Tax=Montipora capricornis TaxID=246305 RepID=UPI0035F16D47